MQNLPKAEIYVREFEFMPWGKTIQSVVNYLEDNMPQEARVLDLMCGPGYLIGELSKKRPDGLYVGVDLESEFINYARNSYPKINFAHADVLTWSSSRLFEVVLCTGGIHHLPPHLQKSFIAKLASFIKPGGVGIIADSFIGHFETEKERLLACANLGHAYLQHTIMAGGSPEMIKVAVDILSNDLLGIEWKTSVCEHSTTLGEYFKNMEIRHMWPKDQPYGDYYFILKN